MAKEIIDNQMGTCNGCKNCGAGCTCGGMHGYGGHPLLRILLALAIIGFVFAAGVKMGELKAELTMGYQHAYMNNGPRFQDYDNGDPQVMGIMLPAGATVPTATPDAATTKTTTTTTKNITQ